MKFFRKKSRSQRVLDQLIKSGRYGSYNHELARVGGMAWHRRITDLRKQGYKISTVRVSGGIFKYYLNRERG